MKAISCYAIVVITIQINSLMKPNFRTHEPSRTVHFSSKITHFNIFIMRLGNSLLLFQYVFYRE